jgi:hypothetical protein
VKVKVWTVLSAEAASVLKPASSVWYGLKF